MNMAVYRFFIMTLSLTIGAGMAKYLTEGTLIVVLLILWILWLFNFAEAGWDSRGKRFGG